MQDCGKGSGDMRAGGGSEMCRVKKVGLLGELVLLVLLSVLVAWTSHGQRRWCYLKSRFRQQCCL